MMKTKNLIGWWPMEGDGKDYSGSNNNLIMSNVAFEPGKIGNALNGYEPQVITSYNIGGSEAITISCWLMVNNTSESFIYETEVPYYIDGHNGWVLAVNYSPLKFSIGCNRRVMITKNIFPLHVFHHVAMVIDTTAIDNKKIRLFVNGIEELCDQIVGGLITGIIKAQRISFFRRYNPVSYKTVGLIDDVKIYNKALTYNDIKRIYMGLHPLG